MLNETKNNLLSAWQGATTLVITLLTHAFIYFLFKKRLNTVSVITFNAIPCFAAGIFLSLLGWYLEQPDFTAFSRQSILATLYVGIFAGAIGIVCYFELQRRSDAFGASLVFFIFPLIALGLNARYCGSAISSYSILMLGLLLLSVYLTLRKHTCNDVVDYS